MVAPITDMDALEALYGTPGETSLVKVTARLTPAYARWIGASRFTVLVTVGPEGTDGSPRGDDGPVVRIQDDKTLLLPDWRGNNRIDSLRNIIRDGRVSLMFMVPGSTNVIRVNGHAILTDDATLRASFARGEASQETHPRSVIVITITEVYSQCARAIMRAGLWAGADEAADLPTVGEMMAEAKTGFDGATYDAEWAGRAAKSMW